MHRFINRAILYLGNVNRHNKANRTSTQATCRARKSGKESVSRRCSEKEPEHIRRKAVSTGKEVLQSRRKAEQGQESREARINLPLSPPHFLFLCCLFTSFWLGFIAFKPALLHDENIIQNQHYWFDTFAFEQFLTHHYTTSNFIGGAMVIGAIILFYKLAEYFYEQKENYYFIRMDDPLHTKVYNNWSLS